MAKPLILKNLAEAVSFLDQIEKSHSVSVSGEWSLDQNLIHCAHSLEFALSGYPIRKTQIFQDTIGTLVFHFFDWRGYMRHPTSALVPGEPEKDLVAGQSGIDRLRKAIAAFDAWDGPLQRHRFYGSLSKKQYARANAMHIANHLELLEF